MCTGLPAHYCTFHPLFLANTTFSLQVGIDLVAMSVNDIVTSGAQPMFFLDYYATGNLDVDAAEQVIKGIVEGCNQSGCMLLGGETAEMPGFYQKGEYDLAGFAVGSVKKDRLIDGSKIKAGDVVLAFKSSGVHSNGFSLVRKILEVANMTVQSPCPWVTGKKIGEVRLDLPHTATWLPRQQEGLGFWLHHTAIFCMASLQPKHLH